jgi:hypothetical protein
MDGSKAMVAEYHSNVIPRIGETVCIMSKYYLVKDLWYSVEKGKYDDDCRAVVLFVTER